MNPIHKQQDANIPGDLMSQMSSLTPVIEFEGKNIMGSTADIIINCSLKDQRNKGKKPVKKGAVIAKSLYPKEYAKEIDLMLTWYLTKFKPHSAHLFN